MSIIQSVLENIIFIYFVFLYLGYIAILALAEVYYFKKNKRKALMVLAASIIPSVLACVIIPMEFEGTKYSMNTVDAYADGEHIGSVQVLSDRDRKIVEIGSFVRYEEIGPVCYELSIEEGIIKGDDELDALAIKKAFDDADLSIANFSGETKAYDELLKVKIETEKIEYPASFKAARYTLCVIPAAVVALIYLVLMNRQKKKNMLIKSKLEDL